MTDQIQEQDVELDEIDEIEEAHDPENASMHSAKATDAAASVTKKAPARKGDKSNSEPMPKTKAGMLNAIYTTLAGKTKTDVAAAYKNMFGEEAEMEDEVIAEASVDVNAELKDLVEGEATLSEEFKEKTAVLFETALKSRLSEEIDRLESNYAEELAEEIKTINENMVEKVDSYLNYVVENWMEENKLAIQNGLRTEISENFMAGLKTLFEESYIEVPDSKVDLVDDLSGQVEELEEKLNNVTRDAIELSEAVELLQREQVIAEATRDLADTQAEKLASLVEDIDFDDVEAFAKKVATIKESYFTKTASVIEEEIIEDGDETVEVSPVMERYLTALNRSIK